MFFKHKPNLTTKDAVIAASANLADALKSKNVAPPQRIIHARIIMSTETLQ